MNASHEVDLEAIMTPNNLKRDGNFSKPKCQKELQGVDFERKSVQHAEIEVLRYKGLVMFIHNFKTLFRDCKLTGIFLTLQLS